MFSTQHSMQTQSKKYKVMNSTAQTTDTRIIQLIIATAAFIMLSVAMIHFSKNTSMSVPAVKQWTADTSWVKGWK